MWGIFRYQNTTVFKDKYDLCVPSPRQPRWSLKRYLPHVIRSNISKRQIAVLTCLFLTIFVWFAPSPSNWQRQKRHAVEPQTAHYQVLRPTMTIPNEHTPNPEKWLKRNSNNKFAALPGAPKLSGYDRFSPKPRAALISFVYNSELEGILQSMRQLEYHWNRKYQYPWIFFNDETFNDEFKVRNLVSIPRRLLTTRRRPHPALLQLLVSTRWFQWNVGHSQTGLRKTASLTVWNIPEQLVLPRDGRYHTARCAAGRVDCSTNIQD